MSGYVYAGANPLREVDPEGLQRQRADPTQRTTGPDVSGGIGGARGDYGSRSFWDIFKGCNARPPSSGSAGAPGGSGGAGGGIRSSSGSSGGRSESLGHTITQSGSSASRSIGPGIQYDAKIEGQMPKRGWTRALVESTVRNPAKTVAGRDTRHRLDGTQNNDPATIYFSRRGGYLVRNDRTGEVVQVSDRTDPNWGGP